MDSFLDKHAFFGPSITVYTAGGSFAAEATFNGCIAFFNWAREEVERLLPPDLELAVNRSASPELHPVSLVFGDQTEGAWIVAGRRLPLDFNYQELALAVPFVKHRRGRYLHTYVPRMYSSYWPAVWAGNVNYGLGKRMGTMGSEGPFFLLRGEDGALLMHAAVEARGDWIPGSRCDLPNFAAMQEIFSLPVVGCTARGAYVCSYFGWDFAPAMLRSADCCLSIDAQVLDGLTPRWCHDVPSGTVEVRGLIWRLTWPLQCRF